MGQSEEEIKAMSWQSMLPPHLQLPTAVAAELEAFRSSIGCPDEPFAVKILGAGWATRRTQRITYDQARREDPTATEAELVRQVYEVRKLMSQMSGLDMPALPASCTTFDAFVDFVIRTEARYALPDPFGWGARIDAILAKAR